MHTCNQTHIGDSNGDCLVKARKDQIHSGIVINRDCVVEAGCQEAVNWCMFMTIFVWQCETIVYSTERCWISVLNDIVS